MKESDVTTFLSRWWEHFDFASGLLIGSVQLAVMTLMACILVRMAGRSAVSVHRIWLAALLLTALLLPVHLLTLGWVPLQLSLGTPRSIDSSRADALAVQRADDVQRGLSVVSEDIDQVGLAESVASVSSSTQASNHTAVNATVTAQSDNVSLSRLPLGSNWFEAIIAVMMVGYGVVFAVVIGRLALGFRKLNEIWNDGRVLEASSSAIFASVAGRIGLYKTVHVRAVERLRMPLVFGIFQCKVLVPADFEQWTIQEQESVAFHELTHVKRYDIPIEIVTRFVCAVYWFHPASWLISSRLRQSREWATDETVLRFGLSPSSYAHSIVAILSRLNGQPHMGIASPGVAMSLYGNVEQRLQKILSGVDARRSKIRGMLLLLAMCVAASATCFKLMAAESVAESVAQTDELPTAPTAQEPASATTKFPAPDPLWETIEQSEHDLLSRIRDCEVLTVNGADFHSVLTVEGQVKTPNGVPVEGAIVLMRESSTQRISFESQKYINVTDRHLMRTHDVFARTITDRHGNYRFEKVKSPGTTFGNPWEGSIVAGHPKLGVGWTRLVPTNERVRNEIGVMVTLSPMDSIAGRYVSPKGKPLSGAVMYVNGIQHLRSFGLLDRPDFDLQVSQLTPRATTAEDGSFKFTNMPISMVAVVAGPPHAGWLSGHQYVATSPDVPLGLVQMDDLRNVQHTIVASPFEVKADAGYKIPVKVVDTSRRPVKDVSVRLSSSVDSVMTDENGYAEVRIYSLILAMAESANLQFRIQPSEDTELLPKYVKVPRDDVSVGKLVEVSLEKGARVTGVVTDEAGQPLSNIYVRPAENPFVIGTGAKTNANGRYSLKLKSGEHTLLFSTDIPGFALPTSYHVLRNRGQPFTEFPHVAVTVAEGQSKDLGNFKVTRVSAFDVSVYLPNGQPAEFASVIMMDSNLSERFVGGRQVALPLTAVSKPVQTIAGQARLITTGQPSPRAIAVARYLDGQEVLAGSASIGQVRDGKLEIRLEAASKLEGQVQKEASLK